jgi:hypothetical protein
MESEDVSQPLDDAGLLDARPGDPPGASTVSDCGAAIVIPSKSAARPQVEQNRAPSGRSAPQLGQATAEFYATENTSHGKTQKNTGRRNTRPQKNTEEHRSGECFSVFFGVLLWLSFLCLSVFVCGPYLPVFVCVLLWLVLPAFVCGRALWLRSAARNR